MQHPISEETLSPQIAKVCGKNAPLPLKQMAASGLAPLGGSDLATALYVLTYDKDKSISEKAKKSLAELPVNVLDAAIDQLDNGIVLDGLTQILLDKPRTIQKILFNTAVLPETVIWIAGKVNNEQLLEIVASNEQRLLEFPAIIEALYKNPSVRMSTADRAVELAIHNGVELKGISCFQEIKSALKGDRTALKGDGPAPKRAKNTEEDEAFKNSMELQVWKELDEKAVDEVYTKIENEEDVDEEDTKKFETLEQSIAKMSISAKIRTATLGSSSQRAILIRDSNKLVAMAVVQSPGLSEAEIMQYSKYRSLPEEAVRYMARNRDWTKHYTVKLNLVKNPRCPLEVSMRFLNHLRNNDVRALERDKNIPQAIAVAAKKLRNKRTK